MPPKLRVLAGPCPSSLTPITVNTSQAHHISSDVFEGQVVVHIKGLSDDEDTRADEGDNYFARNDRQGVTWSIQVQGRFLKEYSADDVLFGNTFDRPLKLPWGTSAALGFMYYIDPTLIHDLQSSTKPWALSPLISTMPYFAHARTSGKTSTFPSHASLVDDLSQLYLTLHPSSLTPSPSSSPSISPAASTSSLGSLSSSTSNNANDRLESMSQGLSPGSSRSTPSSHSRRLRGPSAEVVEELKSLHTSAQRRSYFSSSEKRRNIIFGPSDLISTDFCYGFLSFSGPSPALHLPGGLSFDLGRYWDGQPVRFMCCERKGTNDRANEGEEDLPWGKSFWCVAIEMEEEKEAAKDVE